jgi:transposase
MRFIGLDIHRDFCEVAISEGGKARAAGRIAARPEELALFAQSLGGEDRVVVEATGNALAIARVLEPHVAEVVLAHPKKLRAICEAKVKSDKADARTLAELLAADLVPRVWVGDERTRLLRRLLSRRRQLVKQRAATKNATSAVLMRNLKGRPPCSDLFGRLGRQWLAELELPVDERQTVDASLRQLEFLGEELALVDRTIAEQALASAEICRLMTIPGVDVTTAATLIAVIGDVRRFPTSGRLVGYLGLHPRLRQSGTAPARRPRHRGRYALFAERTSARRGRNIATVAVARKLSVLAWHLLTRG